MNHDVRTDALLKLVLVVLLAWPGTGYGILFVIGEAPSPPPSGFSFLEDFGDGDHTGWLVVDEGDIDGPSRWSASTGTLTQSANIYSQPSTAAGLDKWGTYAWYTGGVGWTDYWTALTISSGDDDAIGLMFRYQDSDNYYRFSWDTQRGYRRLIKKVNGVSSLLAADGVRYVTGRAYQLEILAQGSTLEVYIDGALIFSVNDGSLSGGTIALYSWGNIGSYFDDVAVESLSK